MADESDTMHLCLGPVLGSRPVRWVLLPFSPASQGQYARLIIKSQLVLIFSWSLQFQYVHPEAYIDWCVLPAEGQEGSRVSLYFPLIIVFTT
jgi:hypothetical protein